MAESDQPDRDKLFCSICSDLLKDPVTIPCGHSYCRNCIKDFWEGEDQGGTHICPQCRETFEQRPGLSRNTMIEELIKYLKKMGVALANHCYAGPEDVACDACTGRKMKAVKSCLTCSASFCENHLQPHYDAPPLKKHKLVNPSKNLQESKCSRHDRELEIFCRPDQQCICYLCTMDEHKGHETVPAAAERAEKQKKLQESQQQIHQRIQDQKEDVKLLQQEVEAINHSADKTVEDSEKIFTELIHLLQKRSSEVKQQIRSQQETEVSRVKDVRKKLEQEITELKRKDAELEQLSLTEDHTQFLLNYPSLPALRESTHSSSINIRPLRHFEDVTAAVDGFLKYSQEITLDPNTAHNKLLLSEGNRKVTSTDQQQSYPDHPDRFSVYNQVLSRESLTERCYWEVAMRGGAGVGVAVSYQNINKAEPFGFNDKSWSLNCTADGYIFHHNKVKTAVSGPVSSRIGVYLDNRAGILSFYSVSETMTLLHRVQTRFTQPLYVGIRPLFSKDSVEFIKLR
uniref:Tripartite motif-containing protein 16-like n=1 Tax=Poecilia mexicana TaxID=48701 RepID=A0A3B3YPQ5_9TELE